MSLGDQMHMVTETAQRAQTVAASTADSIQGIVNRMNSDVSSIVGSQWAMDSGTAFGNSHTDFSAAVGKLRVALEKVGTDTGANAASYIANDQAGTSGMNTVQVPPFNGALG